MASVELIVETPEYKALLHIQIFLKDHSRNMFLKRHVKLTREKWGNLKRKQSDSLVILMHPVNGLIIFNNLCPVTWCLLPPIASALAWWFCLANRICYLCIPNALNHTYNRIVNQKCILSELRSQSLLFFCSANLMDFSPTFVRRCGRHRLFKHLDIEGQGRSP